ncbi:hypothetical protein Scep_007198 [Stephania cephalantha]|uniref:Uncharacterized protein n=1 Tax=Stephania cephalantha TaxID=152367 RepID=A0AAP0K9K0_9MAGN
METECDEEDFFVAFMARSPRLATPRRWSRWGGVAAVNDVLGGELSEHAFVGVDSTDVTDASPLPRHCLSRILPTLLHHLCRALSLLRRPSLSSSAASCSCSYTPPPPPAPLLLLLCLPFLASSAAPPSPPSSLFSF